MYHQPCIDLSYHQALPPAPPLSIDLTPDTVYAVYCEKEDWWAGPHWCRGWLLDKEYTFFVLDFGFIITVPPSHILPLPPACCGVPPQVRQSFYRVIFR